MATGARVNPTEFAILGLLAEESRSGYDIKTEVEARLSHFWSESYGHIYPMLRRLQQRKLIAVRAVERKRGRPDRRVYSLTESGRQALEAWFGVPPAATRPRNEFLLRLFLGRYAPPGTLLRDVSAYRERVATALGQLRGIETAIAAETPPAADAIYWKLVISYGTRVFEALEEWSAMAEAELRRSP